MTTKLRYFAVLEILAVLVLVIIPVGAVTVGTIWTQQTVSAGWATRYGAGSVVMQDGSIVLMGGQNDGTGMESGYDHDVWRSTDKGITWSLQTANAGWDERVGFSVVVLSDDSIVIIGGKSDVGAGIFNDVWRSTDKGITWIQQNASAGWTPRSYHSSVVMSDDSIVLMGGTDDSYDLKNDTWRSTDKGITWYQLPDAGWTAREGHTSIFNDGEIIVMGGYNGIYKNDVWRSNDNGTTWALRSASAGWTPRSYHSSVVMWDDSIVVIGGSTSLGVYKNDVWRSTSWGSTWTQVNTSAGWSARDSITSVALPDGSIVLMGGSGAAGDSYKNDVWRSTGDTPPSTCPPILAWGSYGSGDGQFQYPEDAAVDSSGNVYVTDYDNNRIQKFSSTGTFITKWGEWGDEDGQFYYPIGIAIDSSDNVYVADQILHRIQKFSSTGTFITKWGEWGDEDGQFYYPIGIAIDSSGNVYVGDLWNSRIQKFSSDGTFITKWGSFGSGDGQFQDPEAVAVDSSGNVYVTDTSNNRIQKFSSSGSFLMKWGSEGSGDGQFSIPTGVAVDSSGNVYVTDTINNRIQKFSSDGTFLTKWGTSGTGDGQFNSPGGIVSDSSGNIYVADTNNHRIQRFGCFATTPVYVYTRHDILMTQPQLSTVTLTVKDMDTHVLITNATVSDELGGVFTNLGNGVYSRGGYNTSHTFTAAAGGYYSSSTTIICNQNIAQTIYLKSIPVSVWAFGGNIQETHIVRFLCKDWQGQPIVGMKANVTAVQTTLGALDWILYLFGINLDKTLLVNNMNAGVTTTFTGYVNDAETNQTVSNAQITVTQDATTISQSSGAGGEYSIAGVLVGNPLTVRANKTGYFAANATYTPLDGGTHTVNISMIRDNFAQTGVAIVGVVRGMPYYAPLSGSTVVLSGGGWCSDTTVTTGMTGYYKFDTSNSACGALLTNTTYTLIVDKNEWIRNIQNTVVS